jgi:hypothetical protein
VRGGVNHEDPPQGWQARPDFLNFAQGFLIGDHGAGGRVGQSVPKGFGAKAGKERSANQAGFQDAQKSAVNLGRARQKQKDTLWGSQTG